MTTIFVPNQKVRAPELNDILTSAILPTSLSVVSSTVLADAAGLAVPLLADSVYAIDGWFYYQAAAAGDLRTGWRFPSGADGWWSTVGPDATNNPVASQERRNYTDFGVVPLNTSLVTAGDDDLTDIYITTVPRGFIETGNEGGTLQVQFAQGTSNATATILHAGSWLRIARLP